MFKVCSTILVALVAICVLCMIGGSRESPWPRLRRMSLGTWNYGVRSEFAAVLSDSAPLSKQDAVEASSLIATLLVDADFAEEYTISSCYLEDDAVWHVSFHRDNTPVSQVNIEIHSSGFVKKVKVVDRSVSDRTYLYQALVGANMQLTSRLGSDDKMTAALCAREITGILNNYCHSYEVTLIHFDDEANEWTIHLYSNTEYGAKITLDKDFQLLEYTFAVITA